MTGYLWYYNGSLEPALEQAMAKYRLRFGREATTALVNIKETTTSNSLVVVPVQCIPTRHVLVGRREDQVEL